MTSRANGELHHRHCILNGLAGTLAAGVVAADLITEVAQAAAAAAQDANGCRLMSHHRHGGIDPPPTVRSLAAHLFPFVPYSAVLAKT